MKKPIIIILLVAILFIAGVFIIRRNNSGTSTDQEETQNVPDLPVDQRPIAMLIPKSDGHWLTLKVEGIKVPGAVSMDYELLYKANNGQAVTTQGVPGTVQLKGLTSVSRDLLLGSESSGKFRYDKDVENGTLTIRFRDGSGKLLGKVMTDWHLQTSTTVLTSVDGSFKYTLDKAATGVWFVTMQSFGNAVGANVVVYSNGWAIFSSDGLTHTGK
ncbi:MAG TPA: hypothetical protein VLE44_02600 [Candidatus Saccharimonadales bacterium]|nr:hypothetical protein [Candidatus Saccharimonadales bacterium]